MDAGGTWRRPTGGAGARAIAPVAIFVATLGVYLRTMAPTVYTVDSAELTTGAYTLGITHPPGHPTYLIIGKLFSLLPVGDVGYRLNFMSGFFGALTVTFAYLICRQLSCSVVASTTASLLLGFSYFFWADSVVAEIYTLNSFFLALLILLLLIWRKRHNSSVLFAIAFLYGLSFGSHTGSVLFAPGIAAFLLVNRNERDSVFRSVIGMLPCFLLGLSIFAYLPIRYMDGALNLAGWFDSSGRYHSTDLTTWEGFRWFVSGDLFRSAMFAYDAVGLAEQAWHYLGWLWQAFAGVGIVLGALGLLKWTRSRPKDALATGLLFASPLLFFLDYAVLDKDTMFLPTYTIWSLWIGAGSDTLLQELSQATNVVCQRVRFVRPLTRTCLLALPLLALVMNYRYADVSWDHRFRDRALEIMEGAEQDAIVLGQWNDVQPMLYLQKVEALRPDLLILNRTGISAPDLARLVSSRISTTPIYSANFDPSLSTQYDFQPLDIGYRMWRHVGSTEQLLGQEQ